MPYKEPKIEKVLFTIGEVADLMHTSTSTIRYWENQFDKLKPKKNKKGNRLFTQEDVELVRFIHHLVKERGLTIKGAKQKLKDNPEETIHNYEIVKHLKSVRQQLLEIKDQLDETNG